MYKQISERQCRCHWVSIGVVIALYALGLQQSLIAQKVLLQAHGATALIPFVGCNSDGETGPQSAPSRRSKAVDIPKEAARKLAYYKAKDGIGVLAPRGWHCFGTYGSNGSSLYVSPDPIHRADLFSNRWRGFAGSAIQISSIEGDTSGRFEVARFIARVYPAHRDFVQNVIAEGIEPASAFPSGPYPTDKLTYRSKEIVEYVTPANTTGLGTNSHLQQNEDPISGVAILAGEALDLVHLSVRLPPQDNELIRIIVRQTERDAQ